MERRAAWEPSRREMLTLAGLGLAAGSCRTERSEELTPRPSTQPLIYDEHGGLMVEALVEGAGPVRMVLDTGASRSALSSVFAEQLGLELHDGGTVEGSAGRVEARAAWAEVELQDLGRLPIDFTVYEFGSYDPACVGILGHELLCRAPFRIRYRERRLEWRAPPPARTLPMSLDSRIPRITADVNGEPVELRIDTGAALPPSDDAYVNLTADQAEWLGLTGPPSAVFGATGTGGERLELRVHRLESLSVGEIRLPRAFAIVQPRVGYFAREDAVGFLGNSVLDKLAPYFDYERSTFGTG